MTIASFLFSMIGCRELNLYKFKSAFCSYENFEITVQLEGTFGKEYEFEGKKKVDWGFPYSLLFSFETLLSDVDSIEVIDVSIIGLESQKHHVLPDSKTNRINNLSTDTTAKKSGSTAIISLGEIDATNYKYEDYEVSAVVLFRQRNKILFEKKLKVILKKDFKQTHRSDWFDKEMSV